MTQVYETRMFHVLDYIAANLDGDVPRDAPLYELYENTPADAGSNDLVTLTCVPLA